MKPLNTTRRIWREKSQG